MHNLRRMTGHPMCCFVPPVGRKPQDGQRGAGQSPPPGHEGSALATAPPLAHKGSSTTSRGVRWAPCAGQRGPRDGAAGSRVTCPQPNCQASALRK